MSKAGKLKAIKGMNDVLPGHKDSFLDSDVWRLILEKGQAALKRAGLATFSCRFVNPPRSFIAAWAIQPISYRKRCTHLRTGVAVQ